MTEDKIINGKALYTPKGAAKEYGRIGCNFYTGCPHECEYCYLKRGITGKALGDTEVRLKKCFKDEADAARILRMELDKHLEQCQRHGIFLSFTTDPMIDETRELTSIAIIEATIREFKRLDASYDTPDYDNPAPFGYYSKTIHRPYTAVILWSTKQINVVDTVEQIQEKILQNIERLCKIQAQILADAARKED